MRHVCRKKSIRAFSQFIITQAWTTCDVDNTAIPKPAPINAPIIP
jgi:hypothetical protein